MHLGMGLLRVSLDGQVRSGGGGLASQAKQFDYIVPMREDTNRS